MIDTHAHLDAGADPPDTLIARAHAAGVERILTVGTTVERCRTALELAEKHAGVYAILGIHPHDATTEGGRVEELRDLLAHERAVAIGETGLDYYRDYAPRDRQREVFEAQLGLARELELPVVVHTRAAGEDTRAALAGHDGPVVMHCFSSPELLGDALQHGWYVSFAGNVTYPNAYELRAAARAVPPDRLLAETDMPYLAPQPVRGKKNEPAYVVHTYAVLAELRGADEDALASTIVDNANRVFALP